METLTYIEPLEEAIVWWLGLDANLHRGKLAGVGRGYVNEKDKLMK
jgi:hypothetical protein